MLPAEEEVGGRTDGRTKRLETWFPRGFPGWGASRGLRGGLAPAGCQVDLDRGRPVEEGILRFRKRFRKRVQGFWGGSTATCKCLLAIPMNSEL